MRKNIFYLLLLSTTLILSGCGEDEGDESNTTATTQGWHFQGRDCLACHNVNLQDDKNLLVAGTVYKTDAVTEQDNTNEMCGGNLRINFYDSANPAYLLYSSNDYVDANSKGYQGKGNVFILNRMLGIISLGNYYIEIADKNNTALTSKVWHSFSAQPYDVNNPIDYANRVSCNACHSPSASAPQKPIYVDILANINLCE